VPTTILSLVLAAVLLVPGFAYALRAERDSPSHKVSGFRETASIAIVSAIANTVVLTGFGLLRVLLPGHTPDVGKLIRTPADYAKTAYAPLTVWALVLLGSATLLAYKAADKSSRLRCFSHKVAVRLGLISPRSREHFASAWWSIFTEHSEGKTYVGCHLSDGTFVGGTLRSFNRDTAETGDRELTLAGEIAYRPPGATQTEVLQGVGGCVVRADKITLMTVSHIEETLTAP